MVTKVVTSIEQVVNNIKNIVNTIYEQVVKGRGAKWMEMIVPEREPESLEKQGESVQEAPEELRFP